MTEYAVFEDGVCIEAGFRGPCGHGDATAVSDGLAAIEPGLTYHVAEICPDHDEQPRNGCEECDDSDDDE